MAKILNKIASVVAVIAQVVAVVATLAGHPEIAAVAQIVAAAAGATAAVSSFFMKPPDLGGSSSDWKADPQAGIPYVIGRTAIGGNIVHHTSFGNDNKFIIFVTVMSYGPIEEYEALEVDKTTVTFAGSAATGYYSGIMWKSHQLGAVPEGSALIPVNGTAPGWDASSKLSGLAADMWELKYDVKGDHNYKNGVPKPLRILKGVKVYDPRLDDTFPGGSGACRALEEDTYVYSDNPWLHFITWALGRWQEGKKVLGVGMPVASLALATMAEAATIAETNNWTCGGTINSVDDKWDRLKAMAQAGGGTPIRLGAQLSCMVNVPRVSLATITREDLAGSVSMVGTTPRRNRVNGVVPRYRSEAHDWEVVPASEVRVSAYVTADGGERTKEVEFPLVQDVDQAAQLARYEIENLRERGPITLQLKPKWIGYKPGDCLTVDIAEMGLSSQTCIIRNRSFDPGTGIVTLEMMTETAAKHTAAGAETGAPPPTTDTTPPDTTVAPPGAGDWAITATSITSGGVEMPALVIEGAVDNDTAEFVIFEYRIDGATDWNHAGTEVPTVIRKVIEGLNPDTDYEAAVSYMAKGERSTRLVLSPETTPSAPYLPAGTAAVDIPNTPAGNIAATNLQAAINELDTEKQPTDADLDAVAGSSLAAAWTTYTPTIGAQTGSFTSVSATGRWVKIGKIVHFHVTVRIVTNGTAAGFVTVTLPHGSVNNASDVFQQVTGANTTGGFFVRGSIQNNTSTMYVVKHDNTYPGGDGAILSLTGAYEAA